MASTKKPIDMNKTRVALVAARAKRAALSEKKNLLSVQMAQLDAEIENNTLDIAAREQSLRDALANLGVIEPA